MDPTANLKEQLALSAKIQRAYDSSDVTNYTSKLETMADDANRLAELVIALNEWIQRGGFLPITWKPLPRSHFPESD